MDCKGIDVAIIRRPKNGGYTHGFKFEHKRKNYGGYLFTEEPNFEQSGVIELIKDAVNKVVFTQEIQSDNN